ncbi:MAG TPA: hypothetical protein PKD12_08040 [Nitrospira sp.]|nr:hypothetical protein [Nitrospira sp.]
MVIDEETYLEHYGILRKSGRYPWGSGGNQDARNRTFLDTIEGLRKDGMSDTDIARGFGMTTTQLRAVKSIALAETKNANIRQAQRMKAKGMSNVAIGERMGLNESSVRALLSEGASDKADVLFATADMLKRQVAEKELIDIGTGVEHQLGLTRTKLDTAVAVLKEEGYQVHRWKAEQLGTGKMTEYKVLVAPGMTWGEARKRSGELKQIVEYSEDGGKTFFHILPPKSIDSSRVDIRYAEQGGTKADGVIYVRPGVKDISLGGKNYAQVRIAVDGTHYLKGMAVYKDDLPAGVDIQFNTNKSNTGKKHDAMKPIDKEADPTRPFGAEIKRQIFEHDAKGDPHLTSVMNIVNEQGDWAKWSKNLPSQMLSKQSPKLAQQQLNLTFERRQKELESIMALTNPLVRKKLLESYAEDTDAAAVHLKAAALPRQTTKVLLPIASMKEAEAHIPSLENGTRVALIRFPHGGTFEIPEVTVNNKNKEAKSLIGTDAFDAIGINAKVAERLSGADFDGDTVLVIPNNRGDVKTTAALEGLKNFDSKSYKIKEGSGVEIDPMGQKMGDISNLITDMTIQGASAPELARAVRHSMVVIDSEKHGLDVKASAQDHGIAALKQRYQGKKNGGASTIISRASSPSYINERRAARVGEGGPVNKQTGKLQFVETGKTYTNRRGEVVPVKSKVKKLALTDDAHTLVSSPTGTRIERIYADHSNSLKALANAARKEAVNTKNPETSASAKQVYSHEVASLEAKLRDAKKNAPLERQAQAIANARVRQLRQANPDRPADEVKKIKSHALAEARVRTGAKKNAIKLEPKEWQAIQAGAISAHKLKQILDNADIDNVRTLATPREATVMTAQKLSIARQKLALGYTLAEVAADMGVPPSTISSSLEGGG